MRAAVIALIAAVSMSGAQAPAGAPKYERVYTLKPREGVFAYARIAPDGNQLVYASRVDARNPTGPQGYLETIVDLKTGRVLFSESGIDAYWSLDGKRLIWSAEDGVGIRHNDTGEVSHRIAPNNLGDYYSWAVRDGRDLILTIDSKYYYLDGNKAVMPAAGVKDCGAPFGTGERPLISKDGKRITTFVKGNIVVRGLDNCDDIFDTGIQGAKADFSWDGRYIAFHALKKEKTGYEIRVVDVQQKTVRTLPGLDGSALFPSWTKDGRLCFRYDGEDFRGFMLASGVLDIAAEPLPAVTSPIPNPRSWRDIFPSTPDDGGLRLVLIWAPWSAHSQLAFGAIEQARTYFARRLPKVSFVNAADPASSTADVTQQLKEFGVTIPRIPLTQGRMLLTEARNQMPTTLMFRDGVIVDRRLGAQTFEQLRDWIEKYLNGAPGL